MMTLMNLADDLGKRIKAHRIGLHLSQREAAEHLGISERTLQNWEAGTTFPWPKHRRAVEQFLREPLEGTQS
jgi:transcriptional regulator with XRE-family HTH domain